ncbi:DUF4062 domain-containing protein [Neobacillus niacini]|uniref:DUF4062 domain-containing protein n=1 Tax=Neobacillus niacini TaxID=86668 RepID=UPI003B0235F9
MQKKLQVFISSTFTDLHEERQAAVQAVLNAGHIPAGMELFKAGDKSQKETIKRWIEESDVYMLILGGRYGSIEEDSGKSYTHWEYDYAGELGKPRFAIVIKDSALDEKVKVHGQGVLERENYVKYTEFKKEVLGKVSKFYFDIKDIKLTVLESLKEFERDSTLSGWISGKSIVNQHELLESNFRLLEENQRLSKEIEKFRTVTLKENEINGYSFDEVKNYLESNEIELTENAFGKEVAGTNATYLELFIIFKDSFAIGIENSYGMDTEDNFLFFRFAPKLISLDLLEKVKVAGKPYQRIQTSKYGYKFLAIYEMEKIKNNLNTPSK